MSSYKPLVLLIGATGQTGSSILKGLLDSGARVAALVRPSSISKPSTEVLRTSGVEIRAGDIKDSLDSLKKTLEGVNVLISAVGGPALGDQKDVMLAAEEAGVQRVVPCDFATPGAKGVRGGADIRFGIREYIQSLGVGYTFIDVGWWAQLYLPLPLRSNAPAQVKAGTWLICKDGSANNLVIDKGHIGTFVARIITDPRTLNKAVIAWDDEVTQIAAHEIGERVSGEGEELKKPCIYLKRGDYLRVASAAAAKDEVAKDPTNVGAYIKENTLENAKALGYLDARELYPDIPKFTLEDVAKDFYAEADSYEWLRIIYDESSSA
ncbi:NAD(P)-binding protein [Dichomitus squalens]|uniref:NAD(P)-binding protein n=1 Tax=Dichomitus squalens TaxID=114155 RepID=A0A4Q9MV82_9APHY|nr:NAD(P)-binding protein [Dichomitus squalens]